MRAGGAMLKMYGSVSAEGAVLGVTPDDIDHHGYERGECLMLRVRTL